MVVTRFSPSPNGPLHVGHIYTCLVNEQFAHREGGKFYVRFDDLGQCITIEMDEHRRAQVPAIMDAQREVIEWMGIPVDGWSVDSEQLDYVDWGSLTRIPHFKELNDPFPHDLPTFVRTFGTGWIPYPYTPILTAQRVLLDHSQGVTDVIRGEEFAGEFAHYRLLCDLFGYKPPHFTFLPRLMGKHGDISKTNGGYTIAELRANGYTPQALRELLANACLNYFGDEWSLWNLKREPRIDL